MTYSHIKIYSLFEIILWLIGATIFSYLFVIFDIKIENILTIVSILIMVAIFRIEILFKNKKHIENQVGLLKCLLNELDVLSKDREICCTNIKGHITWYKEEIGKGNIPLHPIKEINVGLYTGSLDDKIKDKSTYELKQALQLLNDKVFLINSYANKLINSHYSELKDKTKKEIKNNFLPRLSNTLPDLEKLVCCIRQILKLNWEIK